jgi:hypothetical protein
MLVPGSSVLTRFDAMLKASLVLSLLQTTLITAGGVLFVNMLATVSSMSDGQLLIGPLSLALVWLGMSGTRPQPPAGA